MHTVGDWIAERAVHRLAVDGASVLRGIDGESLVLPTTELHTGALAEALIVERYCNDGVDAGQKCCANDQQPPPCQPQYTRYDGGGVKVVAHEKTRGALSSSRRLRVQVRVPWPVRRHPSLPPQLF